MGEWDCVAVTSGAAGSCAFARAGAVRGCRGRAKASRPAPASVSQRRAPERAKSEKACQNPCGSSGATKNPRQSLRSFASTAADGRAGGRLTPIGQPLHRILPGALAQHTRARGASRNFLAAQVQKFFFFSNTGRPSVGDSPFKAIRTAAPPDTAIQSFNLSDLAWTCMATA